MRRLMRPALLLLLVAVTTLPAIADKVKDLYAKGQDAEARQQYEAAYNFFKQATTLSPKTCAIGPLSNVSVLKLPPPSCTTARNYATKASSTRPWLSFKRP